MVTTMVDPTMLAVATGLIGAAGAMVWSFLMASKVAAPRAAQKSRLLLVNILTGASTEDKAILETIRGTLIRPEIERLTEDMPKLDPDDLAIDYDEIATRVGPVVSSHMEMAFRQVEAQQAKRTGEFLKEMGIDEHLAGVEESLREEALMAAGPQAQALMEILNMKIPKKASVIEKVVMQTAKAQAAQLLQGGIGLEKAAPAESVSRSSGFGVR